MGYPRNLLNNNEEVVLDLKPHWLYMATASLVLAGSVLAGLAVVVLVEDPPSALSWFCLALVAGSLVWFGLRYASWVTTMFVLTTDRLISRRGILSKSGIEIPLERINTVFFSQSLFERMAGAGDLSIESAGEKGTQNFTDIRKPSVVQREIYVQIEANENRKFDRMGTRTEGLSVAEQIEKLHELKSQGALTPEQFEAEKAKLLGR